MRRRGFTLIELVVAMALAVIVGAVAVQTGTLISAALDRQKKLAPAEIDTRLLEDFLFEEVQEAGGGLVRPWSAVVVDDNCVASAGLPACAGGDRVRVFTPHPTASTCTITAKSATTLTSTAIDTNGDGSVDACCPAVNGMANTVVAVTDPNDTLKIEYYHAGAAATSTASCTLALQNSGVAVAGMPLSTLASYASAQLSTGTVAIYAVDTATHELRRFEDTNHDNTWSASESSTIAPRVFDLQAALGYDGAPADGVISDAASTTDEWVGNVAADTLPTGALGNQLRLVRFGVVVGTPLSGNAAQSIRLLNRPTGVGAANFFVKGAIASAYLRNVFIFDQ
jgi:prepilin-type N-terminal cleavage/methylation domain-containing protein